MPQIRPEHIPEPCEHCDGKVIQDFGEPDRYYCLYCSRHYWIDMNGKIIKPFLAPQDNNNEQE